MLSSTKTIIGFHTPKRHPFGVQQDTGWPRGAIPGFTRFHFHSLLMTWWSSVSRFLLFCFYNLKETWIILQTLLWNIHTGLHWTCFSSKCVLFQCPAVLYFLCFFLLSLKSTFERMQYSPRKVHCSDYMNARKGKLFENSFKWLPSKSKGTCSLTLFTTTLTIHPPHIHTVVWQSFHFCEAPSLEPWANCSRLLTPLHVSEIHFSSLH